MPLLLCLVASATAYLGPPSPLLSRGLKSLRRRDVLVRASTFAALDEPTKKSVPAVVRTLTGAGILGLADETARICLAGTGAPHSLLAGGATIAVLGLLRSVGAKLHEGWLAPGATLLLTWMAAFFAPNLVLLPTAKPVAATTAECAAVALVVVGGLFATLLTTAVATTVFDNTQKTKTPNPTEGYFSSLEAKTPSMQKKNPGRTFGPLGPLGFLTVVSFGLFANTGAAIAATSFFAVSTLAAYTVGFRTNALINDWSAGASRSTTKKGLVGEAGRKVNNVASTIMSKIAHPVVLCAALVTLGVQLAAAATGIAPRAALELYASTGGAALQRLLGPCVVGLACGVYSRRRDVLASWRAVSSGVLIGSLAGIYGTAGLVNLLGLPSEAKLALFPRCITTPLAMPVLGALGGDPPTAFSIITVTGILGAAFGPAFLSLFRIQNPKARGIAMGCAAHGIGTAQMGQSEPQAQPYASIGMSIAGSAMVALALLGPSQNLLLRIAGLP